MITKEIHLSTIEKVKDFTTAMAEYDFEVDLMSGRYTVNGKSIMGIFSLDLGQAITLRAQVPQEVQPAFLQALEAFA